MEKNYSMDSIENLETKLVKLQNEVEIMKKSMALAQTGQNKDSTNDKQEYKNNSLEIKQLEKEVGKMKFKLQRQQLNDFKLMQEAMREKCKETSDLKTNSPKEVLQKLESRVLDLSLKAQSQLQHLKHLERTFNEENEQLKKMTETCRQDDFSTEADCTQRKRYLEDTHYKTVKHIEQCENANEKMKQMLKNGQKKKTSYISLLAELTKEKTAMTQNQDKDVKEAESKECQDMDCEKKKKDLIKLKNEMSLIKDATCCHDIYTIDSAFQEQKAMNKDLTEIAQKAEKHLIELKEEKINLASKRALMKEVDSVYPKSDLSLAKSRLQEQQKRLDLAKEEMNRVNSDTNRTKDVFQKLLVKMNPKVNKAETDNKKDIKQLSKQLENVVKYAFPPAKPKFTAKTKKRNSSQIHHRFITDSSYVFSSKISEVKFP